MSKPAADQLRAYLLTQDIKGVPISNAPLFNMLQDQPIIQTNAQDKSIWKASIDNGRGWKNIFTFLKISPALMWPNPNDRPAQYRGTITVEQAGETVWAIKEDPADSYIGAREPTPHLANLIKSSPALSKQVPQHDELLSPYKNIAAVSEDLNANQGSAKAIFAHHQEAEKIETAENSLAVTVRNAAQKDVTTMSQNSSLGGAFIAWIKTNITSRKLIVKDTKALIHTVDETVMLVTPGIFKRYALEHPELEKVTGKQGTQAWPYLKRAFEKEKIHQKTSKQLNIWSYDVVGPRKTTQLRGYLLLDPRLIFPEQPMNNPSLCRVTEGISQ